MYTFTSVMEFYAPALAHHCVQASVISSHLERNNNKILLFKMRCAAKVTAAGAAIAIVTIKKKDEKEAALEPGRSLDCFLGSNIALHRFYEILVYLCHIGRINYKQSGTEINEAFVSKKVCIPHCLYDRVRSVLNRTDTFF